MIFSRCAPTASNICPGRFLFVRSPEAKARLEPHLDEGNRKQTMAAPWTAIVAYDLDFADHLGKLIPHAPNAKDWFADPEERRMERHPVAARCRAPI